MTTATAVRATALPMPEVTEGEVQTFGRTGTRLRYIVIGSTQFVAGRTAVYTTCWKCRGTGHLAEYAGLYAGVCFACGGCGVRKYAETVEAAQRKFRAAQAKALREEAKFEAERPAREAAEAAATAAAYESAHTAALTEQAERDAAQVAFDAQRYAGEVGGKVTVTGTVVCNVSVETRYGHSRLVIVEGTDYDKGITVKTFGTSTWHYEVEKGDEVTFTATVKDHEVYRGVKQTSVTRPKTATQEEES